MFWGIWIAGLHFPTWVAYPALASVTLNAIIARGVRGVMLSVALFAGGAALWVVAFGFQYWPPTSEIVSTLCFFGALGYTLAVGLMVYVQRERLLAARAEMSAGEARYRLITENAADLIAMVDHDSRWIYTSPSHERILEDADLAPGADAFRRVHPDDADHARAAVVRAVRTGDETYKRASEERLLLAGHAMEGMSEAIMIVAADGTIQTVNRAFTQITGYAREEVIGKPVTELRSGLQPPEFYDEMHARVERDGHWTGTKWNKRKNGAVYKEWRSIRAIRDAAGKTPHYVTVFSEVVPTRP